MPKKPQERGILNQLSLSLLTTPWLVSIMTLDAIVQGLKEIGEASEEVFRGTRLPVLHSLELDQQS
jgi:hypothetical protein